MRVRSTLIALIILVFAGSYLGKNLIQRIINTDSANNNIESIYGDIPDYNRIISLAPNITETLFALGQGNRVVGVTRFCNYPPEALKKENVGGFFDTNYEAIVALKPDLVILLPEHENIQKYINKLGLQTLVVHNRCINEILETITVIGTACGAEDKAKELLSGIVSRMNVIRDKTSDLNQSRVMISIGRTYCSGSLKDIYISGKDTFYDELIINAGGINVYERHDIAYPVISMEGLLYLNPEIIIEMIPDLTERGFDKDAIIRDWDEASHVDAVKNNRIYVLNQDYAVIPGPRFIFLLEDFARILHPEIDWD